MRITRLELDGVGPFQNAVFNFPLPEDPNEPGELVLFEGENGSGKTTLMLAIALALRPFLPDDPPDGVFIKGEGFAIQRRLLFAERPFLWPQRARPDGSFSIGISDGETEIDWRFKAPKWTELQANAAARSINPINATIERCQRARFGEGSTNWAVYSFGSHQQTPSIHVEGPAAIDRDCLHQALFFGADPFRGRGRYSSTGSPLGQLLSNLESDRARAIAYQRDSSDSQRIRYEAAEHSLEGTLLRVRRALSQVLDRDVKFEFRFGEAAPRVRFDGEEIDLDLLGEGLRSTFAWLSDLLVQLLLTPWADKTRSALDQDFWLLLDEVDQSLHPQMQMRLIPALRELFPQARIYATTHSPFVVASAGRGHVFSIQQDRKTRRVQGPQQWTKLEPGLTLERIVSAVFKSPAQFIDLETRTHLDKHEAAILQLRKGRAFDWDDFLRDRAWLMERTEEVRTVVAMREVPVQKAIDDHLRSLGR